jgi:hypothetical protein
MTLKYCQSHKCHTYDTKDRKRGSVKVIKQIKLEEEVISIMVVEISAH